MGDYVPNAPIDEEAKKRNGNLPGVGGVFNYVNLHMYHYAGNNPVKYTDPDGEYLINNTAQGARNARDYAQSTTNQSENYFGNFIGAFVFDPKFSTTDKPSPILPIKTYSPENIELPRNMNQSLKAAINIKNSGSSEIQSKITANAEIMDNGRFEIKVTVSISGEKDRTATVAFAGAKEIMSDGNIDQAKVNKIANETINIVLNQPRNTQNIE
jgi:hypothetical protein